MGDSTTSATATTPVVTAGPIVINNIQPLDTSGHTGISGILNAAAEKINAGVSGINEQMKKFDPTNPGELLKMQHNLANYNLAITVTASIIKSVEDTTKSVAQKLS